MTHPVAMAGCFFCVLNYSEMNEQNTAPHPEQKRLPILARHAISLSVVFVIALLLSYFAAQSIHQQLQINKLKSSDQATFERGVGYVLTHAANSDTVTKDALYAVATLPDAQRSADLLLAITQSYTNADDTQAPASVAAAIAPLMHRMDSQQAIGLYDGLIQTKGIDPVQTARHLMAALKPKTDRELMQVVDLLEARLLWSKNWAPRALWVQWLAHLTTSGVELTQANAARRLGELPDSADDPQIAAALANLTDSEYDSVRAVALSACAGYAAIAKDPTDYEQVIFKLGNDANQVIARRAWMVVGHLNPFSGFAVNWQDAGPFVAEAMLWAATKTNPENIAPVQDALRSPTTARRGLLAASESGAFNYIETYGESGNEHLFALNSGHNNLIDVWRSVLAFGLDKKQVNAWETVLVNSIGNFHSLEIADFKAMRTMAYGAMLYRGNGRLIPGGPLLDERDALYPLAVMEGRLLEPIDSFIYQKQREPFVRLVAAAYGTQGIDLETLVGEIPLSEPALLDLFTLAMTHGDGEVIGRFIRSSHPQMMTMAALASVMKGYTPHLIEGIGIDFLRKHPDLEIETIRGMSDDEISRIGLSRIDALPALLEAAEMTPTSAGRENEVKLLKLALWMRGDLGDDFTTQAEGMLFDEDLPTSTVLMCLLHMKRPIALDYLFGDLTQHPQDYLNELFIGKRWWHVFRRFVDTSDLTLWLWGDPEAQAFQIEAMRQWYAVNRWKIEGGWWPDPKL